MKAVVHTPTNGLKNSLDFYSKLNFKVLSKENPVLVSDGKAIIEINPDRFARAGVKLYRKSWGKSLKELEQLTSLTKIEGGYLLSDANGVWIYLVEGEPDWDFDLSQIQPSVLGNYAGITLETTDMSRTVKIWQKIGFSGTMDQAWVSFTSEDGMMINFLKPNSCPHLFFNPSLTYFNGKNNLSVIQKIRDLNIPITEEITYFNKEGIVDNVIIRDPGGYGFFIFND